MFTGIIEELGRVSSIKRGSDSARLVIDAQKVLKDARVGDSIAVNGVCLTVTSLGTGQFSADVMFETLRSTGLGGLKPGNQVNLERALSLNGRFGGHIVTGHIDGTGVIAARRQQDIATVFTVGTTREILKHIIRKGSIAVDGISLTVVDLTEKGFTVSIIPHTSRETTLSGREVGDTVNLETDLLAKYVEKFLATRQQQNNKGEEGVTAELLGKYGFL